MLHELRTKPGSDQIDVTIGDFATSAIGATFELVYLIRNTITNLTTQDQQVACFRNAAAHLEPRGPSGPVRSGAGPDPCANRRARLRAKRLRQAGFAGACNRLESE